MNITETTLGVALLAALAGIALGALLGFLWAARRQAAEAAARAVELETLRQQGQAAAQQGAAAEAARERVTALLENVRAEAAVASRTAEGLRASLAARLESTQATAADLERRLKDAQREGEQYRHAAHKFETEVVNLRSTGEAERKALELRIEEQRSWIEQQKQQLEERFQNLANTLLEEKSQRFTAANAEKLEAIVAPFRSGLEQFRQRVDTVYGEDVKDRAQLKEQIAQLTQLNQQVAREATNLTNALTVNSKASGNWGETILKGILERSGLREGHEYQLQFAVKGADGGQQFLDAVLDLPEQRQVIIDSKVSNKAWNDYVNAPDETARAVAFADHLRSLRAHVKGLSGRNYPDAPGLTTVDFVLMFVPVEAALLEAMSREPGLYEEAYAARVMLVTPTTLMVVVKLVESLWTVQKRKEFADEIAEAGQKLYDKLVSFVENFEEIGDRVSKLQKTYEAAHGQLTSGRGNAIGIAEGMIQRGVKAKKRMPQALLGQAAATEDLPVPDADAPGDSG